MFDRKDSFWMYILGLFIIFVGAFVVIQTSRGRSILDFSGGSTTRVTRTPAPTNIPTNKVGLSKTPSITSKVTNVNQTPQINLKKIDTSKDYQAKIKTTLGDFDIDLFEKNAPNTVANFIYLANTNYYDNKLFLQLNKDIGIQLGDISLDSSAGYTIADETNWDSLNFTDNLKSSLTSLGYYSTKGLMSKPLIKYSVATVNPIPNSSSSQFLIVLGDESNPTIRSLRGKSTVFGGVIGGFETIQKINEYDSKKISDIKITDVEILIRSSK